MGKFGSRSIAFRRKTPSIKYSPTKCWNGPFRYFDLPPELRDNILRLILLDWDSTSKDAVHLFLTSKRIYADAASIFYYEVLLDNMHLKGTADPFLAGALTAVTPRLHVRNLIIRFLMKEQMYLFGEVYGTALREMASRGKLQSLRLEIGSRFPCYEFWGFEDELFTYDDVRVVGGKGKGTVIKAPLFVTKKPFQNFLKFLEESEIPKITLFVDAEDHSKFWCLFHRSHPSGKKCGGEWKGNARVLKIHWSSLVRALKGTEAVTPVRKDC
ncbi:uncharacterized protein F4812DRAFT_447831 [Daldinia caldariorum]|uniref:uncharacterized protein n=1 Tax=Daldinia caldariorum TaxID=326644 RepID=UPI0020075688|nr:uncharacterized protein F4812DRAFT_447831 [Daldinia caldariorum]KAI1463162.1 hypothetical protein F4812DRAFT_447831 [Daldinia caldariorum]